MTRPGADIVWGELVTRPGQCDLCPVTMEQRAVVSLRSGDTGLRSDVTPVMM